jgi:hypothetical protein
MGPGDFVAQEAPAYARTTVSSSPSSNRCKTHCPGAEILCEWLAHASRHRELFLNLENDQNSEFKDRSPIRLTDERWVHITEEHAELAGHRLEVLEAIAGAGAPMTKPNSWQSEHRRKAR